MDPLALYKAGQLRAAIDALGAKLKKQPLDTKRRTFLFELLCFAGEFDRAEKQINILSDAGPEAASGALLYRSALHAERERQDMFARGALPLGATHPSRSGQLNGDEFAALSDADPRIGAHLEAFIAGSYTWIPFRYIESIETQPPKRLRDLLWLPALVSTTSEFRFRDLGEILLPAIAPLSWKHNDDEVRLSRTTVWEDDATYGQIPASQKMLALAEVELLSPLKAARIFGRVVVAA